MPRVRPEHGRMRISMPESPLYVSFYTTGNGYEAEAWELEKTLRVFGLPFCITAVGDHGSWQRNTQFKAHFLADCLRKWPGRPLVWVDADARMRQRPVLFDQFSEKPGHPVFAAHWREDPAWPGGELLSGTLYFDGSEAAADLIGDWIGRCTLQPEKWDQQCLAEAVEPLPGLAVERLPAPYCLIFDTMRELGPPVIEHTQASRRLKQ